MFPVRVAPTRTDAAEVRQSREDPDGRGAKRDDAEQLNGVACRSPHEEVVGERTLSVVDTLCASNLLDEVPKRRVDEVLIELAVADLFRKDDLSQFARRSGAESKRGSDESLRNRE